MEQAIADQSTIFALVRAEGSGPVIAQTAVLVTKSMEYFAPGRRMNAMQCNLMAETIAEKYPQETLSDVALFIRRASLGEFEEGKTFGALDIGTMLRWWRIHLEEKSAQMEIQADRNEHLLEQGMKTAIDAMVGTGLGDAVRAFTLEAKEQQREADALARMDRLRANLPKMDLEALRDAWKVYSRPNERALIQAQAARTGHLGDELKAAQERIDAGAE